MTRRPVIKDDNLKIRIPADLKRRAQAACEANGRSLSDVICTMLELYTEGIAPHEKKIMQAYVDKAVAHDRKKAREPAE